MSRVVRPVVALVFLLIGGLGLPAGSAGAVEQGTISVHVTWPPGTPNEGASVCFAVTSDASGSGILGSGCTNSDENLVVFGPSDPPLATGVTYYVWYSSIDVKGPGAGTVTLIDGPVDAVIPDTTGNVDVTWEMTNLTTDAMLTVHNSACPEGAESGSLFDRCHANGLAGVEFVVDGTTSDGQPVHQSATTEGDLGAATYSLPAGEYTLAQATMTGEFASYQVYCSTSDGTGVPVDYRGNGRAAVALSVSSGQEVVCDWYNIPAAAAPTEMPATEVVAPPTATTGTAETPVVQLPVTGAGTGGSDGSGLVLSVAGLAILVAGGAALLRRRAAR